MTTYANIGKEEAFVQYSQKELGDLFDTLPHVDVEKMDGLYKGHLFSIMGFGLLPRFMRGPFYTLLNIIDLWSGKGFKNLKGANIWLLLTDRFRFGYYTLEPSSDNNPARINYDTDKNFGFMRAIRGEMKQLEDGRVLARMLYVTKNKVYTVAYFTLEIKTENQGYGAI